MLFDLRKMGTVVLSFDHEDLVNPGKTWGRLGGQAFYPSFYPGGWCILARTFVKQP